MYGVASSIFPRTTWIPLISLDRIDRPYSGDGDYMNAPHLNFVYRISLIAHLSGDGMVVIACPFHVEIETFAQVLKDIRSGS